jgi:hypothetical protein
MPTTSKEQSGAGHAGAAVGSAGGTSASGGWSAALPQPLRGAPKKSLGLTVLVAVLLAMWGKMFVGGNDGGPRGASAMSVASGPGRTSGTDGIDGGGRRARAFESGDELQRWLDADIPLVVSRNLFSINYDYFPMDGSRPVQPSRTANQETFWDQLAKSLSAQADQQEKRANLIQNLRQQAGQMQIASTFMGGGDGRPKALIDGVLVGEGESVAGFRVLKIEPRRVIFEREGIRLEVPMK